MQSLRSIGTGYQLRADLCRPGPHGQGGHRAENLGSELQGRLPAMWQSNSSGQVIRKLATVWFRFWLEREPSQPLTLAAPSQDALSDRRRPDADDAGLACIPGAATTRTAKLPTGRKPARAR